MIHAMTCKNIHILLQENVTSMNISFTGDVAKKPLFNSTKLRGALQQPEVSALTLSSLLRKSHKNMLSAKAENNYWRGLLPSFLGKNANSNLLES